MTDAFQAHESYATVQVTRRQGGQKTLFQSALKHDQTISLQITPAKLKRDLNVDWVLPDGEPYIEVELSEQQWASMVSSVGLGQGTPCTVKKVRTGPTQMMPDPPSEGGRGGTREQFTREFQEKVESSIQDVRTAEQKLDEILQKKGGPTKTDLKELRLYLTSASSGFASNASHVLEMFEEAVEKNVEAAKSEFQAHVAETVRQVGHTALRDQIDSDGYARSFEKLVDGSSGDLGS